jgi:four helix bundle protein
MQTAKGKTERHPKPRRGDDLLERLLEFAARIGKVVDALPETRMGRHVAGQLVRCGSPPAPNYAEACGAESRKDFVHKLSICLKELRESLCWLNVIVKAQLLREARLAELMDECTQLMNIVAKSIVTAKVNNSRLKVS